MSGWCFGVRQSWKNQRYWVWVSTPNLEQKIEEIQSKKQSTKPIRLSIFLSVPLSRMMPFSSDIEKSISTESSNPSTVSKNWTISSRLRNTYRCERKPVSTISFCLSVCVSRCSDGYPSCPSPAREIYAWMGWRRKETSRRHEAHSHSRYQKMRRSVSGKNPTFQRRYFESREFLQYFVD